MESLTDVTTTTGKVIQVKRLGMFDLDVVPKPQLTPFTYKAQTITEILELPLSSADFDTPPLKPKVAQHEAKEGTNEWYDWRTYERYCAMQLHEQKQGEILAAYCEQVANFILVNCVKAEDRSHISADDWPLVHSAAMCKSVTIEDIASALRQLDVKWRDEEIFVVMERAKGGGAAYNACRMWELELMNYLGWSEYRYLKMSVPERARRIASLKYSGWFETLQIDEMEKKNAGNRVKEKTP